MAQACDVTSLLHRITTGDDEALSSLWEQLQGELREIASRILDREGDAVTVQPTQLINESFIRLHGQESSRKWEHRGHFFGSVTRAMGQTLIDRARKRSAVKRGGGKRPISIESIHEPAYIDASVETESIVEAMLKLDSELPRVSDVVWLKIVGNMSLEQIASALDISRRTVASDWQYALVWLKQELTKIT